MTLSSISDVISAAPRELQGAKIVNERLLTPAELGVLLGVSQPTLRKLTQKGNIPFLKIGGANRYSLREIDAYLNAARSAGAALAALTPSSRDFK